MRARRIAAGPEFRLLQDEQEIGYVDGTRVSFRGFAGRDDAAQAASIAYRALSRRRGKQPHAMEESQDGNSGHTDFRRHRKIQKSAAGGLRLHYCRRNISRFSPSPAHGLCGEHCGAPEWIAGCISSGGSS